MSVNAASLAEARAPSPGHQEEGIPPSSDLAIDAGKIMEVLSGLNKQDLNIKSPSFPYDVTFITLETLEAAVANRQDLPGTNSTSNIGRDNLLLLS